MLHWCKIRVTVTVIYDKIVQSVRFSQSIIIYVNCILTIFSPKPAVFTKYYNYVNCVNCILTIFSAKPAVFTK